MHMQVHRGPRPPGYHRAVPSDLAAALAALFASAFLSATLLPGGSEVGLAAVVAHWPGHAGVAVATASAGNTLGGLLSFGIGRLLPAPRTSHRALALVRRYGTPVLLLSWLPLLGDALCVAGGWLRQPWPAAALAIAAGKTARYLVVAQSMQWWGPGA